MTRGAPGGPQPTGARAGERGRVPVTLHADVTVERADFDVQVRIEVPRGGCVAVLGHNGAGKSTLLAALAGTVPLRAGEIRLGDRLLERAGALHVPPARRRVTLLDQKPRLFPHLTVAQNIAFGPRSLGLGRRESSRVTADWLERIGLAGRAGARPHELSGGQQQRVAIARAFAARPQVLLLDEPLAALDAESAPLVRRMLSDELARTGTTSVLVTHELSDAWQWADHCLVLDHGRVVDEASPAQLTAHPRHPFTATLAGYDVVTGTWDGSGVVMTDAAGGTGAVLPGAPLSPLAVGATAHAVVAPRDVTVSRTASPGAVHLTVDTVSTRAGTVRLAHRCGLTAEISPQDALVLAEGRMPRPGDLFWFTPRSVRVLPDEGTTASLAAGIQV